MKKLCFNWQAMGKFLIFNTVTNFLTLDITFEDCFISFLLDLFSTASSSPVTMTQDHKCGNYSITITCDSGYYFEDCFISFLPTASSSPVTMTQDHKCGNYSITITCGMFILTAWFSAIVIIFSLHLLFQLNLNYHLDLFL